MKSLGRLLFTLIVVIGVTTLAYGPSHLPVTQAQAQITSEVPKRIFQDTFVAPHSALRQSLSSPTNGGQPVDPKTAALTFVQSQSTGLLAANPQLSWAVESSEPLDSTINVVRLTQYKYEIPVFGGQMVLQVEGDTVRSIAGTYLPSIAAETKPTLTVQEAFKAAKQELIALQSAPQSPGVAVLPTFTKPVLSDNQLVFFNGAMFDGLPAPTSLAYRLIIDEPDGSASWTTIVDAITGKVLFRYSNIPDARNRVIRDANNIQTTGGTPCYTESGAVGTPSADCTAAFQNTGATYDYYFNTFGRDSFNNAGAPMTVVVRYGTVANAFWNGQLTSFGPGFATRDVVGHEWTHAVTQYTAGLVYANQSGAMNESFSDIFGAMIDRDDWLMGEDTPIGALRDLANPPAYSQPDRVTNYFCAGPTNDNGGVHTNSGIPNKAAFLMADGGTFNGRTVTGIGRAATEQIFYRALTAGLTPNANFNDLYNALLSSAAAIYGQNSAQYTATQTAAQAVELNLTPCSVSATPDSWEPDNAAAQAKAIATNNTAQSHTFHVNGDQDWVSFTATTGSIYTIETLALQTSADTVLTLYNSDGTTQLAQNDDVDGTRASRITWVATGTGTLYVRVTNYSGQGGANTGYQVRVNAVVATVPPDAYETDNTQASAKAITVGGAAQTHNFHIAGDVDWVSFSAVANTPYVIETFNLGATSDTVLSLYNSGGTLLASNDDTVGLASRISWTAPASGIYAFNIRHFLSSAYGATTSYDVRVTGTVATGDAYEADNSLATAKPITVNDPAQTHTIHQPLDQDWVYFDATPNNAYTIETLNLASGNDTVLELYSAANTLLASNDDYNGLASRIGFAPTAAQRLYVKARHFSGSAGSPSLSYDLRVTSIPTVGPDVGEPNNTPAQANVVIPGTPVSPTTLSYNFHVPGDPDWIQVATVAGNVYTFETANLEARCDTVMALFGPDGTTLLAFDDDGGGGLGSRIAWVAPTSANYFVRVTHYSAGVGGVGTGYTLRVSTIGTSAAPDAYETDNTAGAAKPIVENTQGQAHNFHIAGDLDWVSFTAISGVEYTLTTADLGTRTDTVLELYDDPGTTRLAINDDYVGLASRIVWTAPASGTYRALAHHYFSSVGGPNTGYSLRLTSNGGDSYEPDNTLGTAKPIVVNGSIQTHTFHVAGDQDWSTFNAVSGSTYTIDTLNLGSCGDTVLELYEGSTFRAINDDYNGLASHISWLATTNSTLSVKVRHFSSSSAGACTSYDLRVTGVAGQPDIYEPDNTRISAKPIVINDPAQVHTIHIAGDQDWVTFTPTTGSIYTIFTSNLGSCGDTILEIYDIGNNRLAFNDDYAGLASQITWVAQDSTALYARVYHFNESVSGACTSYNLTVTGEAIGPDSFEPDNTAVNASTITVGGATQIHTFDTTADTDWVRFSAVANTTYTLFTANLGINSDTILSLYDPTGTVLLAYNDDYIGYASRIVWTAPTSGNYLLLVRPYGSTGGRANTNYTLAVVTGVQFAGIAPTALPLNAQFAADTDLPAATGSQLRLTTVQVSGNVQVGGEITTVVQAVGNASSYKLIAGAKSSQVELIGIQPLDATGNPFDALTNDRGTLWDAQQAGSTALAVYQPWATDQATNLVALRWRILARPENKSLELPISVIGQNSDGTTWQAGTATAIIAVGSELKVNAVSPTEIILNQTEFLTIQATGLANELPKVYLVDVDTSTETQIIGVSFAAGSNDALIVTIPTSTKPGIYKIRIQIQSGANSVSTESVSLLAAGSTTATPTPTATPKTDATPTATPTTTGSRVYLPLIQR